MRERSTTVLFVVGLMWLIVAVLWGITLYNTVMGIPQILTFGLGSLLTGLFLGRAVQKMRDDRIQKKAMKPEIKV
jgi:hypothetical protein